MIAAGVVTIEELPDIDLAIVTIPDQTRLVAVVIVSPVMSFDSMHPMAFHNATGCFRLLVIHGRRYQFVDRYETWVQYRSRRPYATGRHASARRAADRIAKPCSETWTASAPGSLTPIASCRP